jgi:hypothetical protein
MYLREDIIGSASRIIYGRQGDKVQVIRQDYDMSFVINNGIKFFVRNEKLSKEKIDASPEALKESSNNLQRTHKRKR